MATKSDKKDAKKAARGLDLNGLFEGPLAGAVKASAQQIWLAGMGAFAKAQEEGSKVFDTLVQEGTTLQRKTQAAAEDRFSDVSEKVNSMAGEMGEKANASWDKLESLFETRTAKALKKLGMPTAQELATLRAQVEALTAQVAKLSAQVQKTKTRQRSTAAGPGTATPAAKKAAARKRSPKAGTKAAPARKRTTDDAA